MTCVVAAGSLQFGTQLGQLKRTMPGCRLCPVVLLTAEKSRVPLGRMTELVAVMNICFVIRLHE